MAVGESGHIPVLADELIGVLGPRAGETYVDATAGLGGHAVLAARAMGRGVVVLNDLDPGNLARAERAVRERGRPLAVPSPRGEGGVDNDGGEGVIEVVCFRGSFAELPRRMVEAGLAADMVVADLGFSSNQLEDASRGLSFSRAGPLDMRLDPEGEVTAAELVNTLSEDELAELIRRYGEERHAGLVARKLVAARALEPITQTEQLAGLVRDAIGRWYRGERIDAATRTFQALRIAVNDELGSLESLLRWVERGAEAAGGGRTTWIRAGARVAVISFHSLEDRLVKRCFAGLSERGLVGRLTRKAVRAGPAEVGANPRSRSARLRAIRVLGTGG